MDALNEEERTYLGAYLKMKQLLKDESFKQEVSKNYKAMQAGESVSSEQLKELHNRLSESGL